MKLVKFTQKPIIDYPEFDKEVTRLLPQTKDIASWAQEVKAIIDFNFTITEEHAIKHLSICSTPPIPAGLKLIKPVMQVREMLQQQFGVDFILKD